MVMMIMTMIMGFLKGLVLVFHYGESQSRRDDGSMAKHKYGGI